MKRVNGLTIDFIPRFSVWLHSSAYKVLFNFWKPFRKFAWIWAYTGLGLTLLI